MIKMYKNEELKYEPSKLEFEDGKTAQLSGKIEVTKVGANLLAKITDDYTGKSINQLIFPNNGLTEFLQECVGTKVPCVADVKYITNVVKDKKFQAVEIDNIHINIPSEEEKQAMAEAAEDKRKTAASTVSAFIKSISDPTLRRLCINLFSDKETIGKIMNNPATEHSAYNYKHGMIQMMADTVIIAENTVNALNNSFPEDSTKFNMDLIKAGAVLCNLGRAYMLEFDESGAIVKTEQNIIDNDVLITRDMVSVELSKMATEVDKDGNLKYNTNSDTIKELVHMLVSSKSRIEYSATATPRTKHAMLLADIVSMAFTKGLFETLEKNADNEKFVKAYDGGRNYVLY